MGLGYRFMKNGRISLKEAIRFHGHLGPYLILGILAGEMALKELKCKKYFGLDVRVWGANKKPKSCLIDGLQLSTGATFGKGNIHKLNSNQIKLLICNLENNKKLNISLNKNLIDRLNSLQLHRDCKEFARKLYKTNPLRIFKLTTYDI